MGVTNVRVLLSAAILAFFFYCFPCSFWTVIHLRAESFCSEKISYHMTVSGLSNAHVVMHDSGRSMFQHQETEFHVRSWNGNWQQYWVDSLFSLSIHLLLVFRLSVPLGFTRISNEIATKQLSLTE